MMVASKAKSESSKGHAFASPYDDPSFMKRRELSVRWRQFSYIQEMDFRPNAAEINELIAHHVKAHLPIPSVGAEVLLAFLTPKKGRGRGKKVTSIEEFTNILDGVRAIERSRLNLSDPLLERGKTKNYHATELSHASAAIKAVASNIGKGSKTLEKLVLLFSKSGNGR